MLVTMFLSMWISNTAAMALMVPIVDSICEAMFEAGEDTAGGEGRARTPAQERLRNMMLLACAYSANIGGTGVQHNTATSPALFIILSCQVITGTPANLVVLSTLEADYGSGYAILSIISMISIICTISTMSLGPATL